MCHVSRVQCYTVCTCRVSVRPCHLSVRRASSPLRSHAQTRPWAHIERATHACAQDTHLLGSWQAVLLPPALASHPHIHFQGRGSCEQGEGKGEGEGQRARALDREGHAAVLLHELDERHLGFVTRHPIVRYPPCPASTRAAQSATLQVHHLERALPSVISLCVHTSRV